MSLVVKALAYGTFFLNLSVIAGFLLYLVEKFTDLGVKKSLGLGKAEAVLRRYYTEAAFTVALLATSGSLYMSEILEWMPCRLCWYQRILVYPITLVTATALVSEKRDVRDYVIPFTLIGIPVSLYHYSIQRIDQFQSAGCSIYEVSCSTEHAFYFGYINTPFMAFTAMLVILLVMWLFASEK